MNAQPQYLTTIDKVKGYSFTHIVSLYSTETATNTDKLLLLTFKKTNTQHSKYNNFSRIAYWNLFLI